jgi:hypothetical protein
MNLWNGRSNASEQEEAAVFEVANLLNDGLREAKEKINRIRQDQGAIEEARNELKLQVESEIRQALDELRGLREIKDARGASPSEARPSSRQPKKRLRLARKHTQRRPTTSPEAAQPIYVSSGSDGDGEGQTARG